ncbi:hypothetical protein M378DRAFT_162590 [Amanita muscaria Koide BX008]|uniref:Uncharacterized protein n=1 Tax=Amanita muscaria (strain Koide BX008) TaxID=946122 RepID=A0A0C2X6X9_AMAMK|nr:hypothetical protein M378DRAFT_162590 [Amanita muscaria Koide BX008]
MTSPLDELKKDLEVLRNRIETWETTLEEDLKTNKRVTERDEEWFVDGERAPALVECLEDLSDCGKGSERSGTMDKGIVHTQGALRNKRKRPEAQVSSTKLQQAAVVKKNATLEQRIEILNWYHANGRNQSKTAKHFDALYPNLRIKQPLVSSWVKDELRWREEWENSHGSHTAKRTRRIPPSPSPSLSIPLSSSSTLNNPTDPIVKTEKADDLVATGAHQTVNPIHADVLSIPEESGTMDSAVTDSEIYHAIMDSQEVHENGTEGLGNSNDHDTPTRRPHPTRREALQAALLLKRYLAAIDDPFARKMEASLDLFVYQTRLLEARRKLNPTLLTDYFPRK